MVMMRNLESCSGNDAFMSESDMRRTSRTLPIVLAGSDYVFSGFGMIQRYDNMFGPSNFNAEDVDDFLVMQRDWGVDGGLRTVAPEAVAAVRRRAAEACRAVYRHLGLADFTDAHLELAVDAAGSKDLGETDTLAVLSAAQAIRDSAMTVVDIVAALDETGFEDEAERVLALTRARVGRRLPADGRHLRRADAGALARHRPERLRRTRHGLRADTCPAAARSTRFARRGASTTSRPNRQVGRRRCCGRSARPGPDPTNATSSSESRRRSGETSGGPCPASSSSTCSGSCSPGSRRRGASEGSSG